MNTQLHLRKSLLALSIGLGLAALYIPGAAHAQAASSAEEFCLDELPKATEEAREKAREKVMKAPEFEEVKQDRVSTMDCATSISAELSSWVKGSVSMGFLETLLNDYGSEMTKELCEQAKRKAQEANQKLGEIDKLVKNLPESLEEANRLAREVADQHAREYAQEKVDEYMKNMPQFPSVQTPGYNYGGPTADQATWDKMRELWLNTR